MIFYEKIYYFESESSLPAKQTHEIILMHHQKRFLKEFGSETFLRKYRSLPKSTLNILHRL
jgi:hypothetical protein